MVVLSELIVRSLTKPLTCKRSEVFSFRHGLQISAIGFDAASVFVPHPMQNRTTAELHAFADQSVDRMLSAVAERVPQSR